MASSTIPAILCGTREAIGKVVIETLPPEIEIIHFIFNRAAAEAQISQLLRGDTDVPSESMLGTRNYSRLPAAVIFGGGYTVDDIEKIRAAYQQTEGARPVVWLAHDPKDLPTAPPNTDYAKTVAKRVEDKLKEMEQQGKLGQDVLEYY